MPVSEILVLALLFFVGAALYASVGHGGASSYLAVMGLYSLAPSVMRPTALTLNILVALIGTVKFYRAGLFNRQLFWPFAVSSVPAAFIGGALALPTRSYRIVVGVVLLYAAIWMVSSARRVSSVTLRRPRLVACLVLGLAIGLLSGLTGVGGGIFLSPLLLSMRWAETRQTSAIAAPFILVNSVAGLTGQIAVVNALPVQVVPWGIAAVAGGWIGATYGSRYGQPSTLRRLLAVVLVVAGLKLLIS